MTWCHVPGTDFPSAQEAVALILASCLPSPDSTPAALSNGKSSRETCLLPPSEPDTSPRLRYGAMSQPLTDGPSGARSTPFSRAIHASHSVWPDSAAEPMTNGISGPTLPASSGKSIRPGYSSKTSQAMSRLAQTPCCESYDKWVSRLRLAYSQRKKSARRIKGSGGSAWPTAKTRDHHTEALGENPLNFSPSLAMKAENWPTPDTPSGGRKMPEGTTATGQTPDGRKVTVGLENAATAWPTPMAGTPAQNGNSAAGNSDFSRKAEQLAAGLWETLRASDAEKGGPNQSFGAGGQPLPAQAAKWTTPQAHDTTNWPTSASRDHKGENAPAHMENGTGRLHLGQLPNAVAFLFSRPDHQTVKHGQQRSDPRLTWRRLRRLVISTHGRATWKRMAASGGKRRLNPNFVAWLMGWPIGHPNCDCSATEFIRWQRDMRSALSRLPTAFGPWIWIEPMIETKPEQVDLFGGAA